MPDRRRISGTKSAHQSGILIGGDNQGIARVLQSYGAIYLDPAQAVDLYTKMCSLNVKSPFTTDPP